MLSEYCKHCFKGWTFKYMIILIILRSTRENKKPKLKQICQTNSISWQCVRIYGCLIHQICTFLLFVPLGLGVGFRYCFFKIIIRFCTIHFILISQLIKYIQILVRSGWPNTSHSNVKFWNLVPQSDGTSWLNKKHLNGF